MNKNITRIYYYIIVYKQAMFYFVKHYEQDCKKTICGKYNSCLKKIMKICLFRVEVNI